MANVNGEEPKTLATPSGKKRTTSSRQSQRSKKSNGRSGRASVGSLGAESISEKITESPNDEEVEPETTRIEPEPEEVKTEEDPTKELVSNKNILFSSYFVIYCICKMIDDLSSSNVTHQNVKMQQAEF